MPFDFLLCHLWYLAYYHLIINVILLLLQSMLYSPLLSFTVCQVTFFGYHWNYQTNLMILLLDCHLLILSHLASLIKFHPFHLCLFLLFLLFCLCSTWYLIICYTSLWLKHRCIPIKLNKHELDVCSLFS